MPYAHVGMQPRHDYCLHSQFPEKYVQICLEESAVTAFRYYKGLLRPLAASRSLAVAGTIALPLSHVSAPVTKSLSISTTSIAGFTSFSIDLFFFT